MFENKEVIKILSVDGGGIRGMIPAVLLSEIEKQTGKSISDCFDFMAGTSTGGLLTLFLNLKNHGPATDLIGLYEQGGGVIFHKKVDVKEIGVKDFFRHFRKNVKTIANGPKYNVDGINVVLNKYVGDSTLEDTIKPCLITSYETESRTATFFTNYQDKFKNLKIKDIARATSAAPTYFEPIKILDRGTFIDGGMGANNPAMCAYVEVLKLLRAQGVNPMHKKIVVVSIGTGLTKESYEYNEMKDWNALNWLMGPLLSTFFDANSSTVEYQLQQLLPPEDYFRFQLAFPDEKGIADMDNAEPKNIKRLKELAFEAVNNEWKDDINQLCELLKTQAPV